MLARRTSESKIVVGISQDDRLEMQHANI